MGRLAERFGRWTLARPADAAPGGTVTLTIMYVRPSGNNGNVRFAVRPQDRAGRDATSSDAGVLATDIDGGPGAASVRQVSATWPTGGDDGAVWNVVVIRDSTVSNDDGGTVRVISMSLSYDASR